MLQQPYWQIYGEDVQPSKFFSALASHFPDATTLYVEGTSISEQVEACYLRHAEAGPYLPDAGTIHPVSKKLRCALSQALCAELAALSLHAAEPELADHLHVYRASEEVLCWYDTFAHDLWISSRVPEQRIKSLAAAFGRSYELFTEHS
jgi:hypothetical protein